MRKGFRRVILREGRTTPYRGGKKYAGAVLERRRIGKKKRKEEEAGRRRLRAERVRTGHGSQNRTVGPRFGRFHAFFAWNDSLP